jgi:putative membrane protein
MVKALLISWLVIAVAIALAAAILPSVEVEGGFFAILGIALVFGLVNALIGPVLRFISIPLSVITFGLFSLVVNGILLALTAGISSNLDVGGFFATIVAALVISVFATLIGLVVGMVADREPAT